MASREKTKEEAEYYRAVGAKIREVRMARGLLQRQLASAIGVNRGQLSVIERTGRNLTVLRIVRIARSMDVSVATLVKVLDNSHLSKLAS